MNVLSRLRPLIITVVAVAGLTAGVAYATGAVAPGSPTDGPPAPALPDTGVTSVTPADGVAFPVLGRAPTASDTLPAAALNILGAQQQSFQLAPRLARLVSSSASGDVYLVPGSGELCLVTVTSAGQASSGCSTDSEARSQGLTLIAAPNSGQPDYVVTGVTPGTSTQATIATADGGTTRAAVSSGGGYSAALTSAPVSVIAGGGTQDVTQFPVPTG